MFTGTNQKTLTRISIRIDTALGLAAVFLFAVAFGYVFVDTSQNNWPVHQVFAAGVEAAADDTTNSVTLSWTASGDDGTTGQATRYDIRYSNQLITESSWSSATVIASPPTPKAAGQTESLQVSGLSPDTTYYFALKTYDEVNNASALSNIASKRTAAASLLTCFESWQCSNWSACTNNQETRTCTDANACGTTVNRPVLSFDCSTSTTPPAEPAPTPRYPVASGTSFFAFSTKTRGGFPISSGNVADNEQWEIVVGTGSGLAPQVRIFDRSGNVLSQFFAYDSRLRNGVNVATCDVNGDGKDEIITGQGKGGWPIVKIFSSTGQVINNGFMVFDGKFTGGTNISCGDIDGNGTQEIIVAAGQGGGSQVMVYDASGRASANFFAYAKTFRGGIRVTTADIDSDGRDEIVTGPEVGAPHIQIFKIKTNSIVRLSPGFYAFGTTYRGGVSVAGVDVNGDGNKEIVVGVGNNAQPLIKIYNAQEKLLTQFYGFQTTFMGGANVAGGDVDNDGTDELLVTPRSGGGPQVRVIEVN
jgi:hypothetical protein